MKRRIIRWTTGIMTASILSQFLGGTVSMAADRITESVSYDGALILEDTIPDSEDESADMEDSDIINYNSGSSEKDSDQAADDDAVSVNAGNNTVTTFTEGFSDKGNSDASDNGDVSDKDEESSEPYIFNSDSFSVEWRIVSHWEGACNVSVSLCNRSDETIHNWNLSFVSEDEIINPYNATITSEGSNGNKWTFKNLGYNQDIRPGESIHFGFQVKYTKRIDIPFSFSIDSSEKNVTDDNYEITNKIISSWDGGSVGEIRIINNTDTAIEDWTVTVRTKAVLLNVWGGTVKNVSEYTYEFKCPDYAQNIAAGQTAVIGYQMCGNDTDIEILGLNEWTSAGNKNNKTYGETGSEQGSSVSDNTISDNSISGNTISDNSISENSVSDNSVSENNPVEYIENDGKEHIYIDSEDYEFLDEGTYLLIMYSDIITGYVDHEGEIESIQLKIQDVFNETIWEGALVSEDGFDTWRVNDTGFVLGANKLIFVVTFSNGIAMKEELVVVNREASNIEKTYIELVDEDGDNIYDYYEKNVGTDPDKKDTDGDELDDGAELFLICTDPTDDDTDGDGIKDCDEDEDGDGLSILQEYKLGLSDLVDDFDLDGLSDGYEVYVSGTDPTLPDTDFDGLMDKEELDLGLDPSKSDSDGNGISDGDELILQEISREYSGTTLKRVSVNMMCAGILDDKIYIYPEYDKNSAAYDIVGLIGDPVEIYCDADFDTADIIFTYDEISLGDTKEEDICMVWYDEANNDFVLLEESFVDTVNNTVTYTTTHFSTYLLVDRVKYKNEYEDKNLDINDNADDRDYFAFVVDFTASEESVNEQLRAIREIMGYIDSVEPYSDYKNYDYTSRQYIYSHPKYILIYGVSGGAGDTYTDMAMGYLDCHFNLENYDKIIQYYRDLEKVGTNKYDADFGYAAYKGVCFNGATVRHYFFMGDRYKINDIWKTKIDLKLQKQTSLGVFNTVTLNNYGYNSFDGYVTDNGKVYRAVNGTDAVIEDIIRDLKNGGVSKDLSGGNHSSTVGSKLKYEYDAYHLMLDLTASPADIEKQIKVGESIINQMEEDDYIGLYYYSSSGYMSVLYYFGDEKNDAKNALKKCLSDDKLNEENSYLGDFPNALSHLVLNADYLKTTPLRNAKIYIFYSGYLYDGRIVESINNDSYMSGRNLNQIIGHAAEKDVIINTIAISYPASQYMDSLIPITGGKSYDDSKGTDEMIAEILNDLNAQKDIQTRKTQDSTDQAKDIPSEITVYLPNRFIGVDYLNVDGSNGGNQNWWGQFSVYSEEDQIIMNYMVKRDLYDSAEGYRTSEWGCGLMAMTDLELYLTQQNDGYHLVDQTFTYDTITGNISQYEYMKCANYNRDNVYKLQPGLTNYIIGVTPFDMTDGIEKYLEENGSPYKNASWAPTNNKAGTIDKIETMISSGIPVVFSYHNPGTDLIMYSNIENAKLNTANDDDVFQTCDSHYMTLIGYTKYWDENEYKYILKVESWGEIYYINYDKYAESLSYFSNVLEIF